MIIAGSKALFAFAACFFGFSLCVRRLLSEYRLQSVQPLPQKFISESFFLF